MYFPLLCEEAAHHLRLLTPLTATLSLSLGPGMYTGYGKSLQENTRHGALYEENPKLPTTAPWNQLILGPWDDPSIPSLVLLK